MSTITAILEAQPDGSLHLPLPPELWNGKVKIEAKVESAEVPPGKPTFGRFAGKIKLADDFDAPLEDFKDYM